MISLRPLVTILLLLGSTLSSANTPDLSIDYQQFQLDNGLRVVVHEDHKAPIVAVSVWYHVGSKDEQPGKTGFAHLFEHLMFNGSENYNDEYFKPFEQVGATGMNGTTWLDRTNYFATVPTPALDMALWMESDRMGHLLGVIDQDKLDEQRGVVQNEKRQGDNQPYGKVRYRLQEGLFPQGHPYRWSTIGSMEDLNAASLDDVKNWFNTYYGAANTVLVLAGDIDVATAKPLVEKYFGDIAAGPPLQKLNQWVPKLDSDIIESMHDQVPQIRIYRSWAVPGRITEAVDQLGLFADILGGGKTSRLYQKLVQELQLVTDISASLERHELASIFTISTSLQPGVKPEQVTAILEQQLQQLIDAGPSKDELQRIKTNINASEIRGLEQIGGFGGKAVALAQGALYANDPGHFMVSLERINAASSKDLQAVASDWLLQPYYQLTVLPYPAYNTVATSADRSQLPAVGEMPDLNFPQTQRSTLDNGIEVVFARRDAVPVVEMTMVFDAGYAADAGGKLGLAGFTAGMLTEGTRQLSALEISQRSEELGANLASGSSLDTTSVSLSALTDNLDESIQLYSDIIRNPAFREADLALQKKRMLARIQQEKAQPIGLALRALPPLLYGQNHAYGIPFTGSGTEASVASIESGDLQQFQQRWLQADNAKLFVVGDSSLEQITRLLNKHFGNWHANKDVHRDKVLAQVAQRKSSSVYLIDRPGAPQTVIMAGQLIPSTSTPDNLEIEAMNDIIGGSFTSRINMNLREDKGWAYGAFTFTQNAKGQRPWLIYAPVQTDKTSESILEIKRELAGYLGDAPATADELEKVVNNNTNSLPGQYETAAAVLGALVSNQVFDRPQDYIDTLASRYRGLDLQAVRAAAGSYINDQNLLWVLVGDRAKIDAELEALDLGPIQYLDENGQPLD
ncbi:MAG: pitrilysin family protein [Gammaproteobacteria bacterium]|jgi:zinc protease|nr:pitrilysin family protein [Gammaproteobacteria bacterium]